MGIDMLDIEIATDLITTAKTNDELVLVTLIDGTRISGDPISVNSKGVNLKVDGKVRSFGLKRIDAVDLVTDDEDDELLEDNIELADDIEAQLHDEMTTAELAELMGTTPKALRVSLRALGMGVGKGRKYSLHATAYNLVKAHVEANAAS